jgi:hypothetical protein
MSLEALLFTHKEREAEVDKDERAMLRTSHQIIGVDVTMDQLKTVQSCQELEELMILLFPDLGQGLALLHCELDRIVVENEIIAQTGRQGGSAPEAISYLSHTILPNYLRNSLRIFLGFPPESNRFYSYFLAMIRYDMHCSVSSLTGRLESGKGAVSLKVEHLDMESKLPHIHLQYHRLIVVELLHDLI